MRSRNISQHFGYEDERQFKTYKQHLFIDFRDFLSDVTQNTEMTITVNLTSTITLYNANNNVTSKNKSLGIPPYEYVKTAELAAYSIPKLDDEMYIILDIPEFSTRLHSSDYDGSYDKFSILYFDNSTMNTGDIKPMKGANFDKKIYNFNPPDRLFNKFTITLRKHGGDIVKLSDFGATNDDTATSLMNKISFLFIFDIKL
uniref:Uncharacterized protein n=1 Tax=viral metagenome TaxID=1070528 RepID=A0A6C0F624_9ZZZZ|tara:strand:+ start:922 stop:1524 length:603 start_codon:yes stop_codon:yes gene_type:complete